LIAAPRYELPSVQARPERIVQTEEVLMPSSAIDWPEKLNHLVRDIEVIPGHNGKNCCRLDVDVDPETTFLLNEFEAHARQRQVRIKLANGSGCLRGEMNTVLGLGSASVADRKLAKVRISFHDVVIDDCSDDPTS